MTTKERIRCQLAAGTLAFCRITISPFTLMLFDLPWCWTWQRPGRFANVLQPPYVLTWRPELTLNSRQRQVTSLPPLAVLLNGLNRKRERSRFSRGEREAKHVRTHRTLVGDVRSLSYRSTGSDSSPEDIFSPADRSADGGPHFHGSYPLGLAGYVTPSCCFCRQRRPGRSRASKVEALILRWSWTCCDQPGGGLFMLSLHGYFIFSNVSSDRSRFEMGV